MIQSMTGFGEAHLEADASFYHVEIRSVNNRYLKISLRLPEEFAFLEADLERLIRRKLARGSINFRLHIRSLGEEGAYELNAGVLRSYVKQLQHAAGDLPRATIDLAGLAMLPGVCQPRELSEQERGRRWSIVSQLAQQGLDQLIEMRKVEGEALAADLTGQCRVMRECLDKIRTRIPNVVREYHERLRARVDELIADRGVSLAEQDLVREVAIFAERSDINEELSRLDGHLEQFEAALGRSEATGRKLDFIAQEMLREANTMGSKATEVELARHIITIKGAIDRIKEQVQNAE